MRALPALPPARTLGCVSIRDAMTTKKFLAPFLAAIALTGCGTTAVLEPGSSAGPGQDESIVVLGVNPDYKVLFFKVDKQAGGFKTDQWSGGAIINGVARNGYVVARVRPGQVLALTSVVATHGSAWSGNTFHACGGSRAAVVEVPRAGRVYYLADIEYAPTGTRLNVRYRNNMDAAAEYVRSVYPRIGGEMEQLDFEMLPSQDSCGGGTVTVPIYIGR